MDNCRGCCGATIASDTTVRVTETRSKISDRAPLRPSAEVDDEAHPILVAPAPVLAGLERAHDRVTLVVGVLAGVPVGRGVTAEHLAAAEADSQVDPPVTGHQALLAALDLGARRRLHRDLIQVGAGDLRHIGPSRLCTTPRARPARRSSRLRGDGGRAGRGLAATRHVPAELG